MKVSLHKKSQQLHSIVYFFKKRRQNTLFPFLKVSRGNIELETIINTNYENVFCDNNNDRATAKVQ